MPETRRAYSTRTTQLQHEALLDPRNIEARQELRAAIDDVPADDSHSKAHARVSIRAECHLTDQCVADGNDVRCLSGIDCHLGPNSSLCCHAEYNIVISCSRSLTLTSQSVSHSLTQPVGRPLRSDAVTSSGPSSSRQGSRHTATQAERVHVSSGRTKSAGFLSRNKKFSVEYKFLRGIRIF